MTHIWDLNPASLLNASFGLVKSQVRKSMANIIPFAVVVDTEPMQVSCSLGLGVQKSRNYRNFGLTGCR